MAPPDDPDPRGRGPDVPDPPDATLVHLPAAGLPPPTHTAVCCVRAHREASGRTWYRITATPDVATDDPEVGWVRGELDDAVADVRRFLEDVGRSPPSA